MAVVAEQAASLVAAAQVPRVGVGVFVIRPDGRFIIGRRTDPRALGYGTLALPGGHLELYESFATCAARELREETSVLVAEGEFGFMSAVSTVFVDEKKHYVTILMGARVGQGVEPQLMEPEKCAGWQWCSWEEFKERESELFAPLVNLIREQPAFSPGNWSLRL